MNNSIVIEIVKAPQDRILVDLYRAPNMPLNPVGMKELNCSLAALPPWTAGQGVQLRGEQVLQALLDSHADVRQALLSQLDNAQPCRCPIKFWLRHFGRAEQICWEVLWNRKFLALSKWWPIARIAGTEPRAIIDLASDPIDKDHPLRILALISAGGVEGKEQWNGLYEAVQSGRKKDFPIKLTVLTGEEALSNQIFLQTGVDSNLTVKPISSKIISLERILESESPHLIHFFCHGSATFSSPRLEIATFGSFDRSQDEEKDLILSLEQLAGLESIRNAWLITLNCCQGGAASNEIASLTYSLVAQGVAAVVGMTEELEVLDAHEFCRQFYPEVITTIENAVSEARANGSAKLEWLDALYAPRTAIRDKHPNGPENERQWALPVLYMQLEPIQLHAPKEPTGTSPTEERLFADFLSNFSPERAELIRRELLKEEKGG